MNVERYLRLIAGALVLVSAILAWTVSLWFLAFIAFIGLNLMQSAFTNWCPMMAVLRALGVRDRAGATRAVEPAA